MLRSILILQNSFSFQLILTKVTIIYSCLSHTLLGFDSIPTLKPSLHQVKHRYYGKRKHNVQKRSRDVIRKDSIHVGLLTNVQFGRILHTCTNVWFQECIFGQITISRPACKLTHLSRMEFPIKLSIGPLQLRFKGC